MLPLGVARYVDVLLLDNSSIPITGAVLGNFTITFFRNNAVCSDSYAFSELGGGRYSFRYVPTTLGHDYFEAIHTASGIRTADAEDIVPWSDFSVSDLNLTVPLDHNYGGTDHLKIGQADPTQYTLYVFRSRDWDDNLRIPSYALGSTTLDSSGRWISQIVVVPDTYNIVLISDNIVIMAFQYLQAHQG